MSLKIPISTKREKMRLWTQRGPARNPSENSEAKSARGYYNPEEHEARWGFYYSDKKRPSAAQATVVPKSDPLFTPRGRDPHTNFPRPRLLPASRLADARYHAPLGEVGDLGLKSKLG